MEGRQLEGQSAVPVWLSLTALQGGQEDVPGPGLVSRLHHRLRQDGGRLQLDLLPALEVLSQTPGLVEMLPGQVLVVGLPLEDGAQLQVSSGADQRGRVEVEDSVETADTLLTCQYNSPVRPRHRLVLTLMLFACLKLSASPSRARYQESPAVAI